MSTVATAPRAASENPIRRHLRLLRELMQIRRAIRNWLAVSVAGYLYKFLPLPPRDITVVTREGSALRVPLRQNAGALYPVLDVFAAGAYDHDWRLEDEPVVVDIGAHAGSFLIWLAERYPRLKGVAYEPDPAAREYLESNLRTNRLEAIEVRPEAVAGHAGQLRLFRPVPGGGASSLLPTSAGADSVPTTVVAFGDVVAAVGGDISLVKIDCEGAEYEIVLSSLPASWERIRRVVLEYHPVASTDSTVLLNRMRELGFTCVKGADQMRTAGVLWLEK